MPLSKLIREPTLVYFPFDCFFKILQPLLQTTEQKLRTLTNVLIVCLASTIARESDYQGLELSDVFEDAVERKGRYRSLFCFLKSAGKGGRITRQTQRQTFLLRRNSEKKYIYTVRASGSQPPPPMGCKSTRYRDERG